MSDAGDGCQRVLLIDSDEVSGARLTSLLRSAGFDVEVTAHDVSLPRLGAGGPFDAVILCASEKPSTLSSQDQMGEFVIRYMKHVVPDLLRRTIVLMESHVETDAFANEDCATLREPVTNELLLETLAARMTR